MITNDLPELRQRSLQAFRRELSTLYAKHAGEWVAYRGDQMLGLGKQKHLLYQQCFGQGLKREEIVVFCIEPEELELTLGPVLLD